MTSPSHPDLRLARLRHHHGVSRPLRAATSCPSRRTCCRCRSQSARCAANGAAAPATSPTTCKALGGEPVVMATLGDDGAPYRERLAALGIAADGVRTVAGTYTAQAFIITDLDDNQITAFHPGAMNCSHENRVGDVADIALGIVAPDGRDGMRAHVGEFAQRRHPVRVRPGPGHAAVLRRRADRDDRRARRTSPSTTTRAGCWPSAPGCRSTRSRGASTRWSSRWAPTARGSTPTARRSTIPAVRADGARRPDRLRRRLPRRPAVRHRAGLGLGAHRPPRVGAGRAQDRVTRRAEPRASTATPSAALYHETFGAYLW